MDRIGRRDREARWRVGQGLLVAGALFLGTFTGCGPEPQFNVGQTGSAQVNLNITMPQNVASVSTPQNSLWATVQRWIFGTEAWAATVNEITALVVQVTGPGIASPITSPRVPVSGAVGGQEIPVTLEVPVGTDRVFAVTAINAANKPIFQGRSEPLTLTAGQAETANVRLTDTTIRITTPALPDGTDDRPYAATLLAERGTGTVVWTIQDGVLPPGVTLNGSSGALNGTPTTVGVFPITVRVTDASALFDEERLSIRINPAPIPPRITTTTLPEGTVGNSYNTTIVATGGTGASTWSVASGALPSGLTLNRGTGAITGTPTTEGTSNFTVRATDTIPLTGEKALSITINPAPRPPSITTTALSNGTVSARYNQTLTATGGTGARTWSVSAGSLPSGLALNSTTGAITGTPTTNGTFNFTVRVTDTIPLSNEKPLAITIEDAPKPPVITTTGLPGGRVGDSYSGATLTAASSNGAVRWSVISGTLPPGLTLNGTTGAITGTPTVVGTSEFTVRATDERGLTDEQALFIQISDKLKPPIITTTALPDGIWTFDPPDQKDLFYSATVKATGGTGGLTWEVLGSSTCTNCGLPNGLKLNSSSGAITGVPTTEGTFPFRIRVTDTAGLSDSKEFSINIVELQPLTITTSSLPDGFRFGDPYNTKLEASGGLPPYTWSATSSLPNGLSISSDGVISGDPHESEDGSFQVNFEVRDSLGVGQGAGKTLTLKIIDNG